jgi:TRAP-type C4-dicarboxylate transport system permease small subunit
MDDHDLSSSDAQYVRSVRTKLRDAKRTAWLQLVLSILYMAIVVATGTMFVKFFWDDPEMMNFEEPSRGPAMGLAYGAIIGLFTTYAVVAFARFVRTLFGNKRDKLLVKYYEMATGDKEKGFL